MESSFLQGNFWAKTWRTKGFELVCFNFFRTYIYIIITLKIYCLSHCSSRLIRESLCHIPSISYLPRKLNHSVILQYRGNWPISVSGIFFTGNVCIFLIYLLLCLLIEYFVCSYLSPNFGILWFISGTILRKICFPLIFVNQYYYHSKGEKSLILFIYICLFPLFHQFYFSWEKLCFLQKTYISSSFYFFW